MKRGYGAIGLLVLSSLLFVAWRVSAMRRAVQPGHVVVVRDASGSDAAGCEAIRSAVWTSFDLPGLSPGSTIGLIATGNASNGDQGRLIKVFQLPFSRRVMEGRESAQRRRAQLAEDVVQECHALPRATRSPLFAALRESISYLHGLGCGRPVECFILAETDGAENVNATLRAALAGSLKAAREVRGMLPNEGIRVKFCGFVQTNIAPLGLARNPNYVQHASQIWKMVFTVPDFVEVAPFCLPPVAAGVSNGARDPFDQ